MFFVVSGYAPTRMLLRDVRSIEEVITTEDAEIVEGVRRKGQSVGGVAFFFGLRQLFNARHVILGPRGRDLGVLYNAEYCSS
eukprot:3588968-Rhodomonas_salina.1